MISRNRNIKLMCCSKRGSSVGQSDQEIKVQQWIKSGKVTENLEVGGGLCDLCVNVSALVRSVPRYSRVHADQRVLP